MVSFFKPLFRWNRLPAIVLGQTVMKNQTGGFVWFEPVANKLQVVTGA